MLSQPAKRRALSAIACLGVAVGALFGPVAAAQAQEAQLTPSETYAQLLQEATDRRLTLMQREFYIRQQEAEIAQLRAAIAAAQENTADEELLPLVRNMVAELERAMVADLPFQVERRFALLDDLREDLRADDVSAFDTYRRAMDLYSEEVAYGLQVGSYTGQNPVDPGGRYAACLENVESAVCALSDEQKAALRNGAELEDLREQIYDGNYIHYGRLALMYLERDSSVGYRYNEISEEWDRLPGSELLGLRQDVRIARGESAISTMTAPIRIGERTADAS